MNDSNLSKRKNLNINTTNKLLSELDEIIEKFIDDNEAEIVRLSREKKALGMDEEIKFVSPFRNWCYSISNKERNAEPNIRCMVTVTRLRGDADEEIVSYRDLSQYINE